MANPVCSRCKATGSGVQFKIFSKRGFGHFCVPCEEKLDEPKPDFRVTNLGSIWVIRPVSDNAKTFTKEHIEIEDWQVLGDAFGVDHRPAHALVNALLSEGFEVARV